MRLRACLCPFLVVFLTGICAAQQTPNYAGGISPGAPLPDPELTRPSIMLSGKVVLDDGTPIPGSAAVQTLCKGQRRTVAHTDASGGFSFALAEQASAAQSMGVGVMDASVSPRDGLPIGDSPVPLHNRRQWRECSVLADLPGFTSEIVDIISRTDNTGGNIGSIVLHRIVNVEGLTISATSAAAPEEAKKSLEKGYEQEKKKKLDTAQRSFQKAVDLYPQYAVAWFELGRISLAKGDVQGARRSFNKSLASDSHYVNPYLGMAQIAAQEQKWQEMADLTAKVVALNPINFPNAWFFNGYANYNLGRMADAEKSTLEGIKIDPEHHFPKLEYLLGMVLMERRDYVGANEHMENFLHAVTDQREVTEAKKQLAEISRLATLASVSIPSDKK
jgi:tetratricopeptide (TPR) repeat protein